MKKSLLISATLATLIFTGCGGGGGSATTSSSAVNNSSNTESRSISGNAADGYLIGATVCIDANKNLACDEGEVTTTTGEKGYYEFNVTNNTYPIVVEVTTDTIDTDTNQTVEKPYTLSTPDTYGGFISPLTTSVNEFMLTNKDENLTKEQIHEQIATSLGFDNPDDLYNNYMEMPESEDANLTDEEKAELEKFQEELHSIAKLMVYAKNKFKELIATQLAQSGSQYGLEGMENNETILNILANETMQDVMYKMKDEIYGLDLDDEEGFRDHGEYFAEKEGIEHNSTDFDDRVGKAKWYMENLDEGVSGQVSTEDMPEEFDRPYGFGDEEFEDFDDYYGMEDFDGEFGERPERPEGGEFGEWEDDENFQGRPERPEGEEFGEFADWNGEESFQGRPERPEGDEFDDFESYEDFLAMLEGFDNEGEETENTDNSTEESSDETTENDTTENVALN